MARTFLPSINEELVRVLTRTVLAPREWVVIVNPLDGKTSKPLWGQRYVEFFFMFVILCGVCNSLHTHAQSF